jgi:hypothetical protein
MLSRVLQWKWSRPNLGTIPQFDRMDEAKLPESLFWTAGVHIEILTSECKRIVSTCKVDDDDDDEGERYV